MKPGGGAWQGQLAKQKNNKEKSLIGQIGFWKYDLFPFMLSAEIIRQNKSIVELKNYGFYESSRLLFILPKDKGEKIKEKLSNLKQKRRETLEFIESGFKRERDLIITECKK